MPRTIEHIVDVHVLASDRRRAGRPVWDEQINVAAVFHDDDLTFEAKRDATVARIKASRWYHGKDESSDLHEVVENLADSQDEDEFDGWWDELYDLADYARVWIF